jgi:hypothetical protein
MPCPRKAWPRKLGLLLFCAAGALITALITPISAQKVVSAKAGLISYLQGPAFVDGKRVFLKTARFQQMKSGETLSTGRGRAELLLAPGVVLRLSENAQVRLDDNQLADTRVTLQRGDALIEIVQLPEGNRLQVGLGETTTELTRAGLYRFGMAPNASQDSKHDTPSTLRVYGGEALVRFGADTADAKRGIAVQLDSALIVKKFDRKQTDTLHAWAARRSFDLFMSDPEARLKQTHWQPSGGGYVANKNFNVEFRAFIRRGLPAPSRPAVPSADSR